MFCWAAAAMRTVPASLNVEVLQAFYRKHGREALTARIPALAEGARLSSAAREAGGEVQGAPGGGVACSGLMSQFYLTRLP